MIPIEQFANRVISWHGVSERPHRFGGREFQFGNAEIGHVHTGGIVDIPFPRPLRDALLEEHLAQEHKWVPNSGWTTFRMRSDNDLAHALWLMRLSYLRYVLKTASHANEILEAEAQQLRLSSRFKSLLKSFMAESARESSGQMLSVVE